MIACCGYSNVQHFPPKRNSRRALSFEALLNMRLFDRNVQDGNGRIGLSEEEFSFRGFRQHHSNLSGIVININTMCSVTFDEKQTFSSMADLRIHLQDYTLANNCPYYLKKSEPRRLEARCTSTKKSSLGHPLCQSRVSAYMWMDEIVRVAKMNLLHSHSCREHNAASTHAVHRRMNPIVRNIATVRPQDVINTVRNDHGTPVGYHMAWRALERYKSEKRADDEASVVP
jgi:hypothetical protein